jgi:Gly-Xaa carboxypeptidase
MVFTKYLLLASRITASASVLPWLEQTPLGVSNSKSDFQCDLPPILDPARNGLPSADSLFTSHEALERQVKRHQAIVRVPSVCWDDLGEIGADERWAPFYKLFGVLKESYPAM